MKTRVNVCFSAIFLIFMDFKPVYLEFPEVLTRTNNLNVAERIEFYIFRLAVIFPVCDVKWINRKTNYFRINIIQYIRDGPLEKLRGGGGGGLHEFFFFCSLLVQDFFSGETLCTNFFFFFQTNIAFFSVKPRFIIHFALNKLFYTHSRSKDTGHFLIMWERRKEPWVDGFPVHFCSPCPLEFLCDKNGVNNSYPDVIAAFKVLFELVFL